MLWIDWVLVITPIVLIVGFAIYTQRYVRSVADFLAGGRCAGRYLLANARGESDAGLANTLSKFEPILISGFVLGFWDKITQPIVLLVFISGFVFYRFRETRAMTLAQFFEMRYSRRFRLFTGGLAFLAGILNYGVFPAISSRFFVYFMDLPTQVSLGPLHVQTYALIMLAYLSCTVFMILVGGQVTVMVTDCLEGLLSHAIYIAVVVAVLMVVGWKQILGVMSHAPPQHSMIDPFDAAEVKDFNFWYAGMALVSYLYTTVGLQNKQGFNASARTPHEARMAGVLGNWRTFSRLVMILVLGICAVTFLKSPDFASRAAPVGSAIHSIGDSYLQKQMTIPIALRYLLPVGIKGLFCAMMVMGMLAGDAGHMHSWGSILVQDVILPLRKKPMSPRGHILALRLAIVGVASFAFVFSLLFKQTQYIAMWWAITAAVFTAGTVPAIVGGLYWKRGTTPAAWAAVITGAALCLLGIKFGPLLRAWFGMNFMTTTFITFCIAAALYIVVSFATCRQTFDLDKMLHRGQYAQTPQDASRPSLRRKWTLHQLLGFNSDFSFWDKIVSGGIFGWSMLLLIVNLAIAVWNIAVKPWPVTWWAHYWMITAIALPFAVALVTLVWFGIGGVIDIRDFFRALRTMKRDARDDGRVVDSHNLADENRPPVEPVPQKVSV